MIWVAARLLGTICLGSALVAIRNVTRPSHQEWNRSARTILATAELREWRRSRHLVLNARSNLICVDLMNRREQKIGSHLLNSGGSDGARDSLGQATDAAACWSPIPGRRPTAQRVPP
jgi:hypothetical protein